MDDLFEKYDEDGDGFVSPVEIENQLHAGIITVNNYVATYDEDNDGTLNADGEKLNNLYPGRLWLKEWQTYPVEIRTNFRK